MKMPMPTFPGKNGSLPSTHAATTDTYRVGAGLAPALGIFAYVNAYGACPHDGRNIDLILEFLNLTPNS